MSPEPRAITDPLYAQTGGPVWKRVVIIGEDGARPKHTFDVKLTVPQPPPADWDPEDEDSDEADLWRETDVIIKNVRYGLPSNDELDEGTVGWILDDYYGRPVLLLAEC